MNGSEHLPEHTGDNPTQQEREALKSALTDGYWQRTGYRTSWEHLGPLMDAIFAAGFRHADAVEALVAERDSLRAQLDALRTYAEDRARHGRRNDIVGSARIASDLFQILGVKHDWEVTD